MSVAVDTRQVALKYTGKWDYASRLSSAPSVNATMPTVAALFGSLKVKRNRRKWLDNQPNTKFCDYCGVEDQKHRHPWALELRVQHRVLILLMLRRELWMRHDARVRTRKAQLSANGKGRIQGSLSTV